MDRKRIVECSVCCDGIATSQRLRPVPRASALGSSRRDIIAAHWLPNGDLRFFRQDAKMGGA